MKRKITMIITLLFVMLLCSACGMARKDSITARESSRSTAAANQTDADKAQSTADLTDQPDEFYMIVKHDTVSYQMTLVSLDSGEQIFYEYTDGTEFFDKYGGYALSRDFSEGRLVEIQRINSNDTLGAVAFTDQTWDYEGVHNYSMDLEKRRIDLAGTPYRLDPNVKVFSEGEEKELTAVGDSDVLNVYGIGRTVYAIVVETGHGTLALANTELFEGGWVNLGTKVYAKVTRDMTMELPEGIYDFSVANDGYGDSGEVRIRRDKVTTIDLNDYKGEGPKLCRVTFDVGVAGAVLTVDGKKVNHKKPIELRYGVHTLGVYADGYDAWTRQLVVNSPKAKIEILLSAQTGTESASGTDDEKSTDKDENTENQENGNTNQTSTGGRGKAGTKAGSRAGTYTGGDSSGQSDSDNSNDSASSALANAALGSSLANIITGGESTDYLDTLSDLVDSLDRLNRSGNSD